MERRLGLVIVEGKSYFRAVAPEGKAAVFDESAHPRDRHGKFVEIGGVVNLSWGGDADVLRAVGNGRIEVQRHSDGQKVIVDAGHTTVVRGAPEAKPVYDGNRAGRATPPRGGSPNMTTDHPNWSSATPVEIDGYLQKHGIEEAKARGQADSIRERLTRAAAARRAWDRLSDADVAKLTAQAEAFEATAAAERALQVPGEAEFRARGGWTRAFLVTNAGGHLHRSTACSTCFPTTRFAWLTEYSGMDEKELVELAGERACTVCYPSAPVDVLTRASRLRPDVEARAELEKIRQEKDAKKAEKAKGALTMPDGSEVKAGWDTPKTVISGWRVLVDRLADQLWYTREDGTQHPSHEEWSRDAAVVIEALSFKLDRDPADIRAEAEEKAAKKVKRMLKESEKHARALGLPI